MENKKAIVAIDLDGTLLSDGYTLSNEAKRYLRKLEDQGVLVVLASGRPPRNILAYYDQIGLHSPIIAYNGLYIGNPKDPRFETVERKIPSSLIQEIIGKCSLFLKNFLIENNDSSLFLLKDEPKLDPFFPYGFKNRKAKLEEVLKDDAFVAVFESDYEGEKRIGEIIKRNSPFSYRHWRKLPYSEIYVDGMDKGAALKNLSERFAIAREDIFAFGDGDNDEGMLAFAKFGFAIESTKSALLKSRFPLTDGGNDQDGVIRTLKRYF